jgi:hypothetical protein
MEQRECDNAIFRFCQGNCYKWNYENIRLKFVIRWALIAKSRAQISFRHAILYLPNESASVLSHSHDPWMRYRSIADMPSARRTKLYI